MSCWLNTLTGPWSWQWPASDSQPRAPEPGHVESNWFLTASPPTGCQRFRNVPSRTCVPERCAWQLPCTPGLHPTFCRSDTVLSSTAPCGSDFHSSMTVSAENNIAFCLLKLVSSYCHWVSLSSPILRLSLFSFSVLLRSSQTSARSHTHFSFFRTGKS